MLNRRSWRRWRGWVWATIAIALMGWIVYGSASFQSCINEPQNYAALLGIINIHRDCIGGYIQNYHDAILALFIVVLAFSTIGIWVSTSGLQKSGEKLIAVAQEAAEAAKKSSDIAAVLGQPSVFEQSVRTEPSFDRAGDVRKFRTVVVVGNVGGSFALVTRKCIEWKLGDLPPEPQYAHVVSFRAGLLPYGPHVEIMNDVNDITLTDEQLDRVLKNELIVWVYGFVDYEDSWGGRYRAPFGVRWHYGAPGGSSSGFGELAPEEYHHRTYALPKTP